MTNRAPRLSLDGPTVVVPAKLRFNHPLRLLDLSSTGARVETPEWLAPGRRYTFRVGIERELELQGDVVRCAVVRVEDDADGGRVVYEAGVRFAGMGEPAYAQLEVFLESLAGRPATDALRLASGY
jgi:hypothetical protein